MAFGVCLSLFRRSGGVVVRPYVPVLPYASGDISRLSLARELFRRYYALLSCPSHAAFQLDAQRRDVGRRLGGDAGEAILMHEKAHVLYGHSYDTLLMLLWRPVQWFNPVVWMMEMDLRCFMSIRPRVRTEPWSQREELSVISNKKAVGSDCNLLPTV